MAELYQAHRNFMNRPEDECFPTLEALQEFVDSQKYNSEEYDLPLTNFSVYGQRLVNELSDKPYQLNHFSYQQLTSLLKIPGRYLKSLPPKMFDDVLTYHLKDSDRQYRQFMFNENKQELRCVTSDYHRVWNSKIVQDVSNIIDNDWHNPGSPYKQNHKGLYASDRDMFIFMVNDKYRIDDGTDEGLGRGFFVSNSEVGYRSIGLTSFYYRYVCGNHIVWGAKEVTSKFIKHNYKAPQLYEFYLDEIIANLVNLSPSNEEGQIKKAKEKLFSKTKKGSIEKLMYWGILKKDEAALAYAEAEKEADTYGDFAPNSVWGITQGVTRYSQSRKFEGERNKIDMEVGKMISLALGV